MARHQRKHRENGKARGAASATRAAAEIEESAREFGGRAENVAHRMNEASQQGTRQFAVMGEKAFESWIRTSNEALRRVLEMNVELATWSHEQVDDSLNAVRSLAQCRTIGDAYGVQLGLMRSSMEKSMRHATNMLNLAAHAMVDGSRVVRESGGVRSALTRFAEAS